MRIIDDDTKKVTVLNRNYFFIGTLLVAAVNIILYARGGDGWQNFIEGGSTYFYSKLEFKNLIRIFLNSFAHANWQHCLLNMLCFVICGAWLERKEGTLKLTVLVFVMALVTSWAVTANDLSINWRGYSGVNYGFYAYAIIDFLFSLRKGKRSKFNIIGGLILIGLIYFAACFNGGTAQVSFVWYPYDFMYNTGHYCGFLAGAVLAFVIQLTRLQCDCEHRQKYNI